MKNSNSQQIRKREDMINKEDQVKLNGWEDPYKPT